MSHHSQTPKNDGVSGTISRINTKANEWEDTQLITSPASSIVENSKAIVQIARESELTCSNYCKKGEQPKPEWKAMHEFGPNFGLNADVFLEVGTLDHRGLDGSFFKLGHALVDGETTVKEIAHEYPETFIRFHRGLKELEAYVVKERSSNTAKEVVVWVGPTGCCKSKRARECLPEAYKWVPSCGKWWPMYCYEKHVIMDEFRGQLSFPYMLDLLDRYGLQVETKGGFVQFVADVIHITPPVHPREWYVAANLKKTETMDQLYRRITKIFEYNEEEKCWPIDTELFSKRYKKDALCSKDCAQAESSSQASCSEDKHETR